MSIVLTRKELYDRVWSEPMQKLSKEFGLSDVGLAKTCKRYDVPTPPRGYWAKMQAGHTVRQTPLPAKAPAGYGDEIEIVAQPRREVPEPVAAVPEHEAVRAESEPTNKIEPPKDDLRITHTLLRSTRDYWKATHQSSLHWPRDLPTHLRMDVSEGLRSRALRALQALFSAVEKRGYIVSAGEYGAIQIKVLGEACGLTIRERQRQVRGERRRLGNRDLFKGKGPYELVPTGELELRVDGRFGHRASVVDSTQAHVEERLNEVVANLVRAALAEKDYQAAQERARLAQIERERERAVALQRQRRELARIKRLDDLADAIDRHRRLTACRDNIRAAVGPVDGNSELGRWLEWVDRYLESIDVLRTFRDRQATLTLYHCVSTWEADRVLRTGFADAPASYAQSEQCPSSVAFTDVPMKGAYGGTVCIVIEVPQDAVLPYASTADQDSYRRFAVPAEVANRYERRALSSD